MRGETLDLPDGEPRAYALFAHDTDAAARIARVLVRAGTAVLRTSTVDDLEHAVGRLRERYAAPTLLIGHAAGGAAVLAAAARIPEVRAVVTIGAPAEHPGPVGVPLLVLHSPVDEVVGIENARRIFDAARHPRSFVALDGADHQLSDPADADFAATMIATWASRYLPEAPAPARPQEGSVVVTETGDHAYQQRIVAGRHVLTADEPRPVGDDTGPGPYDLLLASLGACTSMTLRMYAQRKDLPLTKATVQLRHSRVYAEDCAKCETQVGRIDRIERNIHLAGDLDDEQRHALLEIADKCPVHRTLSAEIAIDTALDGWP